jgi:predicted enzyme related to lactoylglutathione lyase
MHIQFADLPVADQDRAKRFYVETLGCEPVSDVAMGPDGWRWIEVRFPGAHTTLHFIRRSAPPPADVPVMALVAEDVPATVEALRSRGVEIFAEPHNPPWRPGRTVAEFIDSEGNRLMLGSP